VHGEHFAFLCSNQILSMKQASSAVYVMFEVGESWVSTSYIAHHMYVLMMGNGESWVSL
jgi:hypothetical protein